MKILVEKKLLERILEELSDHIGAQMLDEVDGGRFKNICGSMVDDSEKVYKELEEVLYDN